METTAVAQWNAGALKCKTQGLCNIQMRNESQRSFFFETCPESKILFAFDVIIVRLNFFRIAVASFNRLSFQIHKVSSFTRSAIYAVIKPSEWSCIHLQSFVPLFLQKLFRNFY